MATVLVNSGEVCPPATDELSIEPSQVLDFPGAVTTTHSFTGIAKIAQAEGHFTVEVPDKLTDPTPYLIAPGYIGIEVGYDSLRHYLASRGKAAVTLENPRTQKWGAGYHPNHVLHPEKLPSQMVWGVMREVQRQDGYGLFDAETWDLIGHSMGGPSVVRAAEHKHPHVRTVTLVGSAGINGHNLREMLRRGHDFIWQNLIPSLPELDSGLPNRRREAALHAAHHINRNLLRTIGEGVATARGDVRPNIKRLGDLGVRTAALPFYMDPFFPIESVTDQVADLVHLFRVHKNKLAGHLAPQLDPVGVGEDLLEIVNDPVMRAA